GIELTGRHIVVLGSGGAARAIAFALTGESGAEQLTLLGIEELERTRLAEDIRPTTAVTVADSYLDEAALRRVLPDAHVLI
ncbi:MAG TPA: shikimate dehydrogenase, partial [Nitrospira sp.]|nr:shikimate dehydrogenase [Nitrospira sp.]